MAPDYEAPRAKRRKTVGGAGTLEVRITPVLPVFGTNKIFRLPMVFQRRTMAIVQNRFQPRCLC